MAAIDPPYINVVNQFGSSTLVGRIKARESIVTQYGIITLVSGNILGIGSGNSEGRYFIDSTNPKFNVQAESGTLSFDGWATGTNCYVNEGHYDLADSSYMFNKHQATGLTVWDGKSADTFGR